jgi:rhodanese-related sulfurtransferase
MQETDLPTIDAAALEAALRDGAQLVDVRERAEYAAGHVPGARLIPMGQLPARLGELDRTRPVHLICASGNRSGAMARVVAAAGLEPVNVEGGTRGWIASGRGVERGL